MMYISYKEFKSKLEISSLTSSNLDDNIALLNTKKLSKSFEMEIRNEDQKFKEMLVEAIWKEKNNCK